jgi:hypothetical protein
MPRYFLSAHVEQENRRVCACLSHLVGSMTLDSTRLGELIAELINLALFLNLALSKKLSGSTIVSCWPVCWAWRAQKGKDCRAALATLQTTPFCAANRQMTRAKPKRSTALRWPILGFLTSGRARFGLMVEPCCLLIQQVSTLTIDQPAFAVHNEFEIRLELHLISKQR